MNKTAARNHSDYFLKPEAHTVPEFINRNRQVKTTAANIFFA